MRNKQNLVTKKAIIKTLKKRIREKKNKAKEYLDQEEIHLHSYEFMSIFGIKEAIEIIQDFKEEPGEDT